MKDSSYNSLKLISIHNKHQVTSILQNHLAKNSLTSNNDAILSQKKSLCKQSAANNNVICTEKITLQRTQYQTTTPHKHHTFTI